MHSVIKDMLPFCLQQVVKTVHNTLVHTYMKVCHLELEVCVEIWQMKYYVIWQMKYYVLFSASQILMQLQSKPMTV